MGVLNTANVAALTTDGVASLTTAQAAALTTGGIAALKTTQVVALTTADIAALKTSQVAALTTADVAALTTDQVAALTTADVGVLNTANVAALTTDQIASLTTAQAHVLTTSQLMALKTTQVAAFTTTQVGVLAGFSSPLVLDLSGNGITTQGIAGGTKFDLNATGQAVNTGWVSGSGEGLLVYDPTNGPITSGSQLFGTATVLPNGQKAANGFAALSAMDSNGDGVITNKDAGWANLKVWVDSNSDGVTQAGELRTLDSLGIVQLNLAATASPTMNNGNLVGMISSFVTSNGQTHEMADIWFQTSPVQSASSATPPTAASALGVQTLATAQVVTLTTTQVAVLAPSQAGTLITTGGLQSQVGGLVQAIGSFSQPQSVATSSSGALQVSSQPNAALAIGVVGVSANVAGMVGALQQFGPNGNPVVTPPIINSVATGTSLTLSPLPNPANTGILSTGGK